MPVNRLFQILYLLLERGQTTAQELAQRFEVSTRTVYRDIDRLSGAGVPVYASQGKGGGIAILESFVLGRSLMTEAEQEQILFALRSLSATGQMESEGLLQKLGALFQKAEVSWIEVDFSRWGRRGTDRGKFETIKNAILGRNLLAFGYVSSYGQESARRIKPAKLIFKSKAWYVQGYCLAKEAYRTFKVDRMLRVEALSEGFETLPPPPKLEEDNAPPPFGTEVSLRFEPQMGFRVFDDFDEASIAQDADGAWRVTTRLPMDSWLSTYLLSFGATVEVLSPAWLREGLAAEAMKIFLTHCKHDTGCPVPPGMIETDKGSDTNQETIGEENTMDKKFCQSCAMPLESADMLGHNADGSPNQDYCKYCYDKGAFTSEISMEAMIAYCAPYMAKATPGMTEAQAIQAMQGFFPQLKRWAKA